MSISYVHYDPATGDIRQISVGAPFKIPGCEIAEFTNVNYWELVDTTQWRVDVNTRQQRADDLPICKLIRIN